MLTIALALTAAAPAKHATINTIVTTNSADPAKKAIINTLPITNSVEPAKPIDQPCNGQPRHDHASALCAQWIAADAGNRSATASERSAFYALLSAIFSAASIGGVIVAITLAHRANRISREAIDAASRPWVHIKDVEIDSMRLSQDGNGSLLMTGSITLINIGQTTAANVGIRWGLSPTPDGAIQLCTVPTPLPSASAANLFPNTTNSTSIMQVTTLDKSIKDEVGTSYIGIEVAYTAPGSGTLRFLREIWTLGSKINHGTVTTLGRERLLAGQIVVPITKMIKTVDMT